MCADAITKIINNGAFPIRAYGASVVNQATGIIYTIAGSANGVNLADVWSYDINAGSLFRRITRAMEEF